MSNFLSVKRVHICSSKRRCKILEGQSNVLNENKLTTLAYLEKTNIQTIVHKTQLSKPKTKQPEPHKQPGVI